MAGKSPFAIAKCHGREGESMIGADEPIKERFTIKSDDFECEGRFADASTLEKPPERGLFAPHDHSLG
jgi:hypothetical protein